MMSTVTVRGQTVIPASVRRRYNIIPHSHLEWIDDGHSVSVVPVPANPIKAMRGKYRGSKLSKSLIRLRSEERKRG
jgi:bifunctional DNA-binding transcriptional regulator/antitoxin component of YhaV-PrlF toxin-antitoxin module